MSWKVHGEDRWSGPTRGERSLGHRHSQAERVLP